MQVFSVETQSFRLLREQRVEFDPGVNVICGANAQGKTSLLEAVWLLTGEKSFRTSFDRELIAFGAQEARVAGRFHAADRDQSMELVFSHGRSRQIRQNGVKKRPSQIEGALRAILFSPDDLMMVRGSAALRRKLMDEAISQLRPGYGAVLGDYRRLYENKLRILKDWREKPSLLDALDEFSDALCRCSARLIRYRASFVRRLAAAAAPIQRDFSSGGEDLSIRYATVSTVTDPMASEREIYEAVALRQSQLRQAEMDAESVLVGAHKDDLVMEINGADARTYASQGQARTAALSVKLAEREIFLAETEEEPVLLLDDVLSELDAARQEFVLNRIGGGQTLISCCEAESVSRLCTGRVLTVEKGEVR
ncbi:MAG: DNA replication and repair protein RecF [Oscillospiraceae bacterium]|nr:DNA replication and repair protein RecF [Oscillospiraceae bacterium]